MGVSAEDETPAQGPAEPAAEPAKPVDRPPPRGSAGDPAAAIGRMSGRLFAGAVRRALRVPAVAEAVRRAREEASR